MDTPDREELENAWNSYHQKNMVHFMLFALQMAAHQNPEKIKSLLEEVFDLSAVEDMARRTMLVASDAQRVAREAAVEVRVLKEQIMTDLENIERAVDCLHARLDTIKDRAFNRGSDDRLLGVPKHHNPYGDDRELARSWQEGWRHAQLHWGDEVNERWPYLRLEAYESRLAVLEAS